MLVAPVLRRWKQENQESEASLSYMVSLGQSEMGKTLSQKNNELSCVVVVHTLSPSTLEGKASRSQ